MNNANFCDPILIVPVDLSQSLKHAMNIMALGMFSRSLALFALEKSTMKNIYN